MSKISAQEAWELLLEKYNIISEIENKGYYEITAKQIKEYKEPRLMAKWDSSESLPKIFSKNKINILPNSRGSYILSDFKLYEKIPVLSEQVITMQKIEIQEYESIDTKNITTEASAINVLVLSNILDDFLGEKDNVLTFNGRMGTGKFKFNVDRYRGIPISISVNNAQCEIDGGFENDNSVIILEAKNIVYPDFHIRQLYYPYRLWRNRVKKPIRNIFTIYSNQIYRMLEYEFEELENYSSIKLVREKNYSLQDTEINMEELYKVYLNTKIKYDDNQNNTKIPFIQADSFERIISLIEVLAKESKTTNQISEIMQFEPRQADYYFNAGRYLDIFEKYKSKDDVVRVRLTAKGREIYNLNYKERQLALVERVLEHKIFNELFFNTYTSGRIPSREEVQNKMRKYNVCTENLVGRRSSSILGWLRWIFNLTKLG